MLPNQRLPAQPPCCSGSLTLCCTDNHLPCPPILPSTTLDLPSSSLADPAANLHLSITCCSPDQPPAPPRFPATSLRSGGPTCRPTPFLPVVHLRPACNRDISKKSSQISTGQFLKINLISAHWIVDH